VNLSFIYEGQDLAICYDTPKYHSRLEEQVQDNYRSLVLATLGLRGIRIPSKAMSFDTQYIRQAHSAITKMTW
jgi:hypothetical protein